MPPALSYTLTQEGCTMARSPNQDANLKKARKLTSEEARIIGRKGGKASGRSRSAMKTFKQALTDGLTEDEQKQMIEALKANAEDGNLPALEFILRILGQHPDQEQTADNSINITIRGGDEYAD